MHLYTTNSTLASKGVYNSNICSSFDIMESINEVYVGVFSFFGVLITEEVGCMFLNYMSFDLGRYDTIMSGQYLKGNLYILFTV